MSPDPCRGGGDITTVLELVFDSSMFLFTLDQYDVRGHAFISYSVM